MNRTTEIFAERRESRLPCPASRKRIRKARATLLKKKRTEKRKRKQGESSIRRFVSLLLVQTYRMRTLFRGRKGTGKFLMHKGAGGEGAGPMTWCGASTWLGATNGRACAGRRRERNGAPARRAASRARYLCDTLGRGRHGPIAVNNSGTVERFYAPLWTRWRITPATATTATTRTTRR